MATIPTTLAEPIRVANLPLPPDVAQEVEHICRQGRYTRRRRAALEENCKLRHHYAGHYVMATPGPQGLLIHAIDLEDPDEVFALRKRLHDQGHRHVYSLWPIPWKDTDDQIATFNV